MIAFGFNGWELIVILVVVLLLFGHRLPGMARSLGSGITEFKRGLQDGAAKSDGANPPASNPPASNPPASNPPATKPPHDNNPSDGSTR